MDEPSASTPTIAPGTSPAVSIGMPVFNGAKTLVAAIESLLAQTFRDFELIVSDNGSTDTTQQICEQFANRDQRIKYIRQPHNQGAARNFDFVLELSTGEYFMWAASDDKWHPQFIERNVAALSSNLDIVASISECLFDGVHIPPKFSGAAPLVGTFASKIARFCDSTSANARFYSLYRRPFLMAHPRLSNFNYVAGDWAYVLQLAKSGNFHLDEGLAGFFQASGGIGSAKKRFTYEGKMLVEQFVPYFHFSRALWAMVSNEPLPTKYQALRCILRLNASAQRSRLRSYLR